MSILNDGNLSRFNAVSPPSANETAPPPAYKRNPVSLGNFRVAYGSYLSLPLPVNGSPYKSDGSRPPITAPATGIPKVPAIFKLLAGPAAPPICARIASIAFWSPEIALVNPVPAFCIVVPNDGAAV